jgi:hypothetical protein
MIENLPDESLVYADKEPDIRALANALDRSLSNNQPFYDMAWRSYNDRRNIWPGKTVDLRKGGPNAFPWQGASDQESNVVGERLDTYVALSSQALERSHIRAMATNPMSLPKAAIVSSFVKWMRTTYIPNFKTEMELAANHLYEKGVCVAYVGWERKTRTSLQLVTMDEIAQSENGEAMVETIMTGEDDDLVSQALIGQFKGMTLPRAKKVLRQLRSKGEAEIPYVRDTENPIVHTCCPDGEIVMPSWITDPQKSPWIFWQEPMTAQMLLQKVETEGWDKEWVDNAILKYRGLDNLTSQFNGIVTNQFWQTTFIDDQELVMVVRAYQRLIDQIDGSEGIFCTIFSPHDTDKYAKHELLNGYDDYPFVFGRLSQDSKLFYESAPMSNVLRGPQMQVKVELDSRIDRTSIATLPPRRAPAGRPAPNWGPGSTIFEKRAGEHGFMDIPPFDQGSIEIQSTMLRQADKAVGLDMDSPLAPIRQQFFLGKFLYFSRDCLAETFRLFQRVGPEEVYFQVSGNADPQTISKGSPDDNFSFTIGFDTMMTDPENAKTQIEQLVSLVSIDRNGRIDLDKLLELLAFSISPVAADYVLQPKEASQEKMLREVTDDLSKIFAGIEVPARPSGAPVALQIIQGYAGQPDVAQRLQQDEAFRGRLENYAGQYSFQVQQAENAQIGKIGTPPASMGGVQTQGMATA